MPQAQTPPPQDRRDGNRQGAAARAAELGARFSRFPARVPRNPATGAAPHQAQFLDMLGALNTRIGDLGTLLDELAPRVISAETVILDSNGTATRQYRVPFRSVAVDYFGAGTITVAAAPLAQAAPGPGPGVGIVGPGGFAVLNFRAYEWTIYGTPGDQLTVTTYARPQPANGVVAPAPPYAGISAAAQGQVTTPTAGQNISGTIGAANLPAGLYEVVAVCYIDGTPAAATDDDNMKFNQSGGGFQGHITVPSNGQVATTRVILPFTGAQTIQIQAQNLATTGAVYHASVTCSRYI